MRWVSVSERKEEYNLSGNEISLLATLLGASEIYGVRNTLFDDQSGNGELIIPRIVENLEKKGILETGLEGIITIERNLFRIIDTIAHASKITGIDILSGGKIQQSCYCYQKDDSVCSLDRMDSKYRYYRIISWESWDNAIQQIPIIQTAPWKEDTPSVVIKSEQIERIRDYLNSFQFDAVKEYMVKENIVGVDPQILMNVIEGQGEYIQIYQTEESENSWVIILVRMEDELIKLEMIDAEKIILKRVQQWEVL